MTDADRPTLVLRFADVGVATYASLRVVGRPSSLVTWVVEEPILLAALDELAGALPDPQPSETTGDALARALGTGAFAAPATELMLAYRLGVLLLADEAWRLLLACVSAPRAVLFVSPSARLARIPWGLLALPAMRPSAEELLRARAAAMTAEGTVPARISWPAADPGRLTEGYRLMELVDVLMAVPPNIAHAPRTAAGWHDRSDRPPLLVLDPRVPGQRPDSPLGSVLGRPSPDSAVVRHFAALRSRRPVLPAVDAAVGLFRRTDADRRWLAALLDQRPSRLLFVGHASAAEDGAGRADRAALHLADHRPLTASDVIALRLPMPPRVALLACASGGDYRFDEATGLVAAMVLGGAQLVTATLWSLPTTAGYTRFTARAGDPMAGVIRAVDDAHTGPDAGCAVNRWQREQMRRWRDGDLTASPVYWAALVTCTVDGAR